MLKADIVSVSGGALGLVVTNLPPGELRDHPHNVLCNYFVCTVTEGCCCSIALVLGSRSSAGVSGLTLPSTNLALPVCSSSGYDPACKWHQQVKQRRSRSYLEVTKTGGYKAAKVDAGARGFFP